MVCVQDVRSIQFCYPGQQAPFSQMAEAMRSLHDLLLGACKRPPVQAAQCRRNSNKQCLLDPGAEPDFDCCLSDDL